MNNNNLNLEIKGNSADIKLGNTVVNTINKNRGDDSYAFKIKAEIIKEREKKLRNQIMLT